MAAKLTRCLCGKIFDPAENPRCPACGAEPRMEIPAAPATTEAPAPKSDLPARTSTILPKPAPDFHSRPIQLPFTPRHVMWGGGGVVAILALVAFIRWLTPSPQEKTVASLQKEIPKTEPAKDPLKAKETEPEKPQPQTQSQSQQESLPKPTPTPAPAQDPATPKTRTVEHKGSDEESGALLADAISKSADGDTIIVRGSPFVVSDSLVLSRPTHLVGDNSGGSPPEIRSANKACVLVSVKGVTIEKLRLNQTAESGSAPALGVSQDAEATLIGCQLVSKVSSALAAQQPTALTATDCIFSCLAKNAAGIPAVSVVKSGRASFSKCEFSGGQDGLHLGETRAELLSCKFHDSGTPDGKGAALRVAGNDATPVTAEHCEFTDNRSAIHVSGAVLTVKGGKFANNGVLLEGGVQTEGMLVVRKAKAFINGATFTANRQGVMMLEAGRAEVVDCRFTGNGLKTENADYGFFCHEIGVAGKEASVLIRGCDFTRGETRTAYALQDGQLTIENSKFADGRGDIFTIGQGASAEIRHCKFTGFVQGGIVVYGEGSATFDDVEMRQNKLGIEVREAGTRVQCNKVIIADNTAVGAAVYDRATFIGTDCTFENNPIGIQVGTPGKPAASATATLENCQLLNNLKADAQACQQSRVTLRNCAFAPDTAPKILREKGATIHAEPPIEGIVDGGSGPAKKGSSTASNDKGTPSKSRTPPSRSRPSPDAVRDIINTVDKMRRMFR